MSLALLREMFAEMVVEKDAAKIPVYYHERFRLCSNGEEIDYASFVESHERYYASPITYRVEYEEETLAEDGDPTRREGASASGSSRIPAGPSSGRSRNPPGTTELSPC